jgi:hypothetical protein
MLALYHHRALGSVLVLGIFLSLSSAWSQITITADDYRTTHPIGMTSVGYVTAPTTPVTVFVGAPSSSASQTWDYSGLTFSRQSEFRFVNASEAPQHAELTTANTIRKGTYTGISGTFYQYNQVTDAAYYLIGTWTEGDPEPTLYRPPVLQIKFPCSLGGSWTYQSEPREIFQGTTLETFQSTTADAYGTLKLPQGSFAALRLKTEVVTTTASTQFSMRQRRYVYNFACKQAVGAFISLDSTQQNNATVTVTGVGYEIANGISALPDPGRKEPALTIGNHPNPFRGSTTIRFETRSPGHVDVRVYDALGCRVRTLVDAERSPGAHTVEWNSSALPAGLYTIIIHSPEGTGVRLAQLIK